MSRNILTIFSIILFVLIILFVIIMLIVIITLQERDIILLENKNEELKSTLSKAIVPKFEMQDVAYRIHSFTHKIEEVMISSIDIQVMFDKPRIFYTIAVSCCDKPITEIDAKSILQEIEGYISQEDEENLFKTKAEAQAKLDEIRRK